MHLEAKRPGKEPTEQQWKRINELRACGAEADWYDTVRGYKKLVGLK